MMKNAELISILGPEALDPALAPLHKLAAMGHIMRYRSGEAIINQGAPVEYIYFTIRGRAAIQNSIEWSRDYHIDYARPMHPLGLVEYMTQGKEYTAFVIAEKDCCAIRIPVHDFARALQQDPALCYFILQSMTLLCSHSMNLAETQSLFLPQDRLGHYLYLTALPTICHKTYRYPATRLILANELHINLRSLYRYLSRMQKQGEIRLVHGKITIGAAEFRKLKERYGSIVL